MVYAVNYDEKVAAEVIDLRWVDVCAYTVLDGEMVEAEDLLQELAIFLCSLTDIHPEQAFSGFIGGLYFGITESFLKFSFGT